MENQPMGDLRSRMMGNQVEESEAQIFKTVLSYCLLILVLPLTAFFTAKSIVFEWLLGQEATIGTNIVSAVVAVMTAQLALGLFIYKAYFGEEKKIAKAD